MRRVLAKSRLILDEMCQDTSYFSSYKWPFYIPWIKLDQVTIRHITRFWIALGMNDVEAQVNFFVKSSGKG